MLHKSTSSYKEGRKLYIQSPQGKLTRQKNTRKYQQTLKGKQAHYRSDCKYQNTSNGRLIKQQKERRRRERKYSLDMQFTNKDAKLIRERFEYKCFNCGSKEKLEIDHHYPLSRGHGLTLSNAVLLCKFCNSSKGNKMPEKFYTQEQLEKLTHVI
jgi:5-methylcytosine-specific restriction endonuclease McrA